MLVVQDVSMLQKRLCFIAGLKSASCRDGSSSQELLFESTLYRVRLEARGEG